LLKLTVRKARSGRRGGFVEVKVEETGAAFTYRLDRKKPKQVRRREGRYLLRTKSDRDAHRALGAWEICRRAPYASRPTAAQNQRRSDRLRNLSVVPTFGGAPFVHQSLSVGELSKSAKCG
jgi:hypothetical protein